MFRTTEGGTYMRKDIIIAGSGGQGVISLAILLANGYGIYENYEVAQTQSYGAAARGGASQASLVVSDKVIDYIEVDKADIFVAFNEPGFKKFYPKVRDDGLVFIDSTLIEESYYKDLPQQVYTIDATYIAEHQFKPFMAEASQVGQIVRYFIRIFHARRYLNLFRQRIKIFCTVHIPFDVDSFQITISIHV